MSILYGNPTYLEEKNTINILTEPSSTLKKKLL